MIGGFVLAAANSARFGEEWNEGLQLHPRLAYFKMREAAALEGEFGRFSEEERDERINLLLKVVRKYAAFTVGCVVPLQVFRRVFHGIAETLDAPTYHASMFAMLTAEYMRQGMILGPVDFIFDEQDQTTFDEICRMWGLWKMAHPLGRQMGQRPIMEDDRDVLPLQAADLVAWLIRRNREEEDDRIPVKRRLSRQLFPSGLGVRSSVFTWDQGKLEFLLRAMKGSIGGKTFVYEIGKKRSKRLSDNIKGV